MSKPKNRLELMLWEQLKTEGWELYRNGLSKELIYTKPAKEKTIAEAQPREKEQSLFTITKAAKKLNVSRQTIYNWLWTGRLYTVSIGSLRFIPLDAIRRANSKKK